MKYIDKNKYKDKKEEDGIKIPTDYTDVLEYFRNHNRLNENLQERINKRKLMREYIS